MTRFFRRLKISRQKSDNNSKSKQKKPTNRFDEIYHLALVKKKYRQIEVSRILEVKKRNKRKVQNLPFSQEIHINPQF